MELEKALRVADYFEFAELMTTDALDQKRIMWGHFREESQTAEGEAMRDDKNYHVCISMGEYQGKDKEPNLNKEQLVFENIEVKQRIINT